MSVSAIADGSDPVRTDHVSYGYGRDLVVDDVSLSVRRGEFLALVGPNGSGKTTLVKLLLGLMKPRSGTVRLFGAEPAQLGERWRIGYVPQRPAVSADLPATVEEVVTTGRLARHPWGRRSGDDRDAVDHALGVVELGRLRGRRVSDLSGGEQQRVFIARALASNPELLVLDEPVAGVDSDAQRLFRDALVHQVRSHDGAVLLISHELGAVAQDLDRVVVMKRRIRFDGHPSALTAEGVSLGVHAEDLPAWLEELR
jgi:zinc transport system ATP-binding protein